MMGQTTYPSLFTVYISCPSSRDPTTFLIISLQCVNFVSLYLPVGVLGGGWQARQTSKYVWWYTHTNTLIYILVSDILMAVLYCSICNYIIVHVSSHWCYCGLLWTSLITSYQSYIALHPSLNQQKIYQYKRCCSHCHPPYCFSSLFSNHCWLSDFFSR